MRKLGLWDWFYIVIITTTAIAAGAEIIPRVDRRQPSFKILSIKEHRVNIEQEGDNQLHKVYAIHVAADGGTWSIWINRDDSRVMYQRFSKAP